MQDQAALFDSQAHAYDQRVELSEAVCEAIAQVLQTLAEPQPGDLLLEIGAGTGLVGKWLAQSAMSYVGVDLSRQMLAQFRQQCRVSRTLLLQADGNGTWPIANGSTRVLFSSRALHWLAPDHVAGESFRVLRPDHALVAIGRVQRHRESVQAVMQRELLRLLQQHGLQGRQGNRHQRQLMDVFAGRGAEVLEPVTAARWTVVRTPRQSIHDWQFKPGLGGLNPAQPVKDDVLQRLSHWAHDRFGSLDREVVSEVAYVIQGVRLIGT